MPHTARAHASVPLRPTHTPRFIEDPAGVYQQVTVNLGESPLMWLRSRGHLSDRLFRAGEQLRADWEAAGLGPRVTMRWDASPLAKSHGGQGRPDLGARRMAAKERFDGALALAGPGLSDILWRVACAGEGLSAAEQALGWPTRAGKLVLTLALARVADFYRVPE